jgi:hypothetical protein
MPAIKSLNVHAVGTIFGAIAIQVASKSERIVEPSRFGSPSLFRFDPMRSTRGRHVRLAEAVTVELRCSRL